MTIRKVLILIFVAIIVSSAFSDSWAASESEFEAKIDALVSEAIRDGQLIGCSALIYKNEKIVFFRAWGKRDREKEKPVKRDTIFRIYSMTKPVTSIAAMQLVEQGKLSLEDPVSKYLPQFARMNVLQDLRAAEPGSQNKQIREIPSERMITIRDLFRHTSGFTYGMFGDTEVDKLYLKAGILFTDRNLEVMMAKLGKIPLLHHPRTAFHYSVSTDVLARVVEVVSGRRFDKYLEDRIFKPLGMVDTFFVVPSSKQDRFAQLYVPDKEGSLKPAPQIQSFRFLHQKNEFFSGGIGLCSTIDDYLQFSKMLLYRGRLDGARILNTETIDLIFSDQLEQIKNKPAGFKFGLGFEISEQGDLAWGGAAGTRFWVHPEKRMIVLFMTQILPYDPRQHGEEIRDIAYKQQ